MKDNSSVKITTLEKALINCSFCVADNMTLSVINIAHVSILIECVTAPSMKMNCVF